MRFINGMTLWEILKTVLALVQAEWAGKHNVKKIISANFKD